MSAVSKVRLSSDGSNNAHFQCLSSIITKSVFIFLWQFNSVIFSKPLECFYFEAAAGCADFLTEVGGQLIKCSLEIDRYLIWMVFCQRISFLATWWQWNKLYPGLTPCCIKWQIAAYSHIQLNRNLKEYSTFSFALLHSQPWPPQDMYQTSLSSFWSHSRLYSTFSAFALVIPNT